MKQIKIGNRIANLVIRTYSCDPLTNSNEAPKYDNQPYTILSSIEAAFNFEYVSSERKTTFNIFNYSNFKLSDVELKNVPLTDKIMNLLFKKSKELRGTHVEDVESDDSGRVFLNKISNDTIIDNIFFFDNNSNMIALENLTQEAIQVQPNTLYKAIYETYYEGWQFERTDNRYFNIDMEVISNEDNETEHFFIHIEKCAIEVDHGFRFENDLSSMDLKLIVLGESWLAQEKR